MRRKKEFNQIQIKLFMKRMLIVLFLMGIVTDYFAQM